MDFYDSQVMRFMRNSDEGYSKVEVDSISDEVSGVNTTTANFPSFISSVNSNFEFDIKHKLVRYGHPVSTFASFV